MHVLGTDPGDGGDYVVLEQLTDGVVIEADFLEAFEGDSVGSGVSRQIFDVHVYSVGYTGVELFMGVDLDKVRVLLEEERDQGLEKNVSLAIRLANEVPGLLGELEAARGCIKMLLRCAVPNAKDHPMMWDAWGDASVFLGEDRNRHRVPHAGLQGGARAENA